MGEGEGCRGRAPVWCLVPGSLWWRGKHAPIPPLFFLIGVGGLGCLSLHLVWGWAHAVGFWGGAPCVACGAPAGAVVLVGAVVGGLVVICIVDASIFVLCVLLGVVFVFLGVRWMPWHQGPMKDVVACDKPRGAGWRAVIRGCPNGGTRRESCRVTRI